MINKVNDIVMKNHTYPFFNDIVNVKKIVSHNIKLDEKSYKIILNYYIGYETIKYLEYIKVYCVNSVYILFSNMNEYFKNVNKSNYFTLFLTNESKENIKNMKNCGGEGESGIELGQ